MVTMGEQVHPIDRDGHGRDDKIDWGPDPVQAEDREHAAEAKGGPQPFQGRLQGDVMKNG